MGGKTMDQMIVTTHSSDVRVQLSSRVKIDGEWLRILNVHFNNKPLPNRRDCQRLAVSLGLTEKQVHTWFKNHRRRHGSPDSREPVEPTRLGSFSGAELTTLDGILHEMDGEATPDLGVILEEIDASTNVEEVERVEDLPLRELNNVIEFLDERCIATIPKLGVDTEAEGWRITGQHSQLDDLAMAGKLGVWVKQLCRSVGVNVPYAEIHTARQGSNALSWDQAMWDISFESHFMFREMIKPMI